MSRHSHPGDQDVLEALFDVIDHCHIGFVTTFSMSLSLLLIILVTMPVTEGMLNMGIDCARQKMEMRTNHTCGKTNIFKYAYTQIRK